MRRRSKRLHRRRPGRTSGPHGRRHEQGQAGGRRRVGARPRTPCRTPGTLRRHASTRGMCRCDSRCVGAADERHHRADHRLRDVRCWLHLSAGRVPPRHLDAETEICLNPDGPGRSAAQSGVGISRRRCATGVSDGASRRRPCARRGRSFRTAPTGSDSRGSRRPVPAGCVATAGDGKGHPSRSAGRPPPRSGTAGPPPRELRDAVPDTDRISCFAGDRDGKSADRPLTAQMNPGLAVPRFGNIDG
jgi:hypothetical protein